MTEKTIEYGDPELAYLFEEEDKNKQYEELYGKYDLNKVKVGEVYDAVLIGQSNDDFLFDANCKDYIRVPRTKNELRFFESNSIGDSVPVLVTKISDPYIIVGSVASLYEAKLHEKLHSLDKNQHVLCKVKELLPAGYTVNIIEDDFNIEAFMPHILAGVNKLLPEARKELVGETLEVVIDSYSSEKKTFVVSRRGYLETRRSEEITKLATVVNTPKDERVVYTGEVTGIGRRQGKPFGVFVEFNECLTGLVHVSNISPEWQNRLDEIQPGTQIDFYVQEVIKRDNEDRIILTQMPKESIWDNIEIGQEMKGRIKSIRDFGVLVSIDNDMNGMIRDVNTIGDLNEGDKVNVKITDLDKSSRKLFLETI